MDSIRENPQYQRHLCSKKLKGNYNIYLKNLQYLLRISQIPRL